MTPDPDGKKHMFDDPRNTQRLLRALYVVCGLLFLIDIVIVAWHNFGGPDVRHAEHWWENLPGFYAIYGFIGCVVLVLVSKQMRRVLMRDEDYYDR